MRIIEYGITKSRLRELLEVHFDRIIDFIPESAVIDFAAIGEPLGFIGGTELDSIWIPHSIDGDTFVERIETVGDLSINWNQDRRIHEDAA